MISNYEGERIVSYVDSILNNVREFNGDEKHRRARLLMTMFIKTLQDQENDGNKCRTVSILKLSEVE